MKIAGEIPVPDPEALKVAFAGLSHDLGKLLELDVFDLDQDYAGRHEHIYQPSAGDGTYTHRHVLGTVAFFDSFRHSIPRELLEPLHEGQSVVNLAAMHHRPSTAAEQILTEADRLSAGMERDQYEDPSLGSSPKEFRRTRLWPLLENLLRENPEAMEPPSPNPSNTASAPHAAQYRYRLRPLSAEALFPVSRTEAEADENRARQDYRELAEEFIRDLRRLPHQDDGRPDLWLEHFDNLLAVYTSLVPSARAGPTLPDISLYDHSRSVAALACALYLYHRERGTLEQNTIRTSDADEKFRFVSGNFFGIQKFIFSPAGTSQRFRSKLLRGRSLAVSLITEAAADLLCRSFGVPPTAVLLNAAGRFTAVLPNLRDAEARIRTVEERIKDWLIDRTCGEVSFGFSHLPLSPRELVAKEFEKVSSRLEAGMALVKARKKIDFDRYGGVVDGYLRRFNRALDPPLCPLCGKRPSQLPCETVGAVCSWCHDHRYLGERLVRSNRLLLLTAGRPGVGGLKDPLFGIYQVELAQEKVPRRDLALQGSLLRYWCISFEADGSLPVEGTAKLLAGYVPRYQPDEVPILSSAGAEEGLEAEAEVEAGDIKTFEHIAQAAVRQSNGRRLGVPALGVLKADVDQLGLLMSCGFSPARMSLSRLACLSRTLSLFFSLWLPWFLSREQDFKDTYTVFSGGDDLFLIGPWDRMRPLAHVIQQNFRDFACGNPEIHLSAGIVAQHPHVPMEWLAADAEEALKESKRRGRNRLTVFDTTVCWDRLGELETIRDALENWLREGRVSRGWLYRLNQFVDWAEDEAGLQEREEFKLSELQILKWRALLKYSAVRLVERTLGSQADGQQREAALRDLLQTSIWLERLRGAVRIPLWECLYSHREHPGEGQ